jgi:histidine ammonia-lyase
MVGQVLRAVAIAEDAARSALGRVNDNPVFLGPDRSPPNGRIVSTGGFHNPAAYHAMNGLAATWADMAVLAAREAEKLHLNEVTGLQQNLVPAGRRSGTRLLTVTAYDLASRAREFAIPALIPLYSAGDTQTDTVMPIFLAFEKEDGAAHCLDVCLAVLCACASQALAVAEREPAPPLRGFLADVRERFPVVEETARDLGADADRLAGDFAAAVLDELAAFGLQ